MNTTLAHPASALPSSPTSILASLAALVSFAACASSLSAQTFVFREGLAGYAGTADTYINNNPTSTADTNYGGAAILGTRYSSSATAGLDLARESRNILIRFDDLNLTGAVDSASLTMTISDIVANSGQGASGTTNIQFLAYDLGTSWTESGATWNVSSIGNAWQTAGAKGAEDRTLAPIFTSGSYTIHGATVTLVAGDTVTIDLPASLVQSWIDNPSSNHGILLSVGASNQNRYPAINFHSSEAADALLRPTLTLNGDLAPIPEPGASALLASLAGLAFAATKRRRRAA